MATLLTVSVRGVQTGRCDSKCYNARESECRCICRGHNHGKGLRAAAERTRSDWQIWRQAQASTSGAEWQEWDVPALLPTSLQGSLFEACED